MPFNEIGVLNTISSTLQQVQDEDKKQTPLWISSDAAGVFGNGGKGAQGTFYISSYNPTQVTGSKGDAAIVATDQGNATAVLTFQLQPEKGTSPSLNVLQLGPKGDVAFPSLPGRPSAGFNLLAIDANGNVVAVKIGPA